MRLVIAGPCHSKTREEKEEEKEKYLKQSQVGTMPCGKQNGGVRAIARFLRPRPFHIIPGGIRTTMNACHTGY